MLQSLRSVAIVAMGPTNATYIRAKSSKKDFLTVDETWVVNSAMNCFRADRVFVMDDLGRLKTRYPQWAGELKLFSGKIMTCREHPDYPNAEAFPINEVRAAVGDDWFQNTVAYMIGLAIYWEIPQLYLYGCDFNYPGSSSVEPGGDNVAYLLGLAKGRGITYQIPNESTLLGANLAMQKEVDGKVRLCRPMYGYDFNPGEAQEKVKRGSATEFDHKIAALAPYSRPLAAPKTRPVLVDKLEPTKTIQETSDDAAAAR